MEEKRKKVHIFGHQNPDTDSTCAAIAYAYLKNKIDTEYEFIPAVLGDINSEAEFVLDFFSVDKPKKITNLKPQVSDIRIDYVTCVHEMDSIKYALEIIVNNVGRSLPVVDSNERLSGVVSISDIVPLLLASHDKDYLKNVKIPFVNLITTLNLELVQGKAIREDFFQGSICIFNDLLDVNQFHQGDLIICNKIEYEAGFVITLKPRYIIVADVEDKSDVKKYESFNGVVLSSFKNTYEIVQAISQAFPIASSVIKENLEYFTTYETLDDVKKNMVSSNFRRFPVVDEWGYIQGMISRSNLMDVDQKKVILVDHNEKGQSIEGVESVQILEIIDHHRVADVQTMGPLYFRAEPVGSTNTIITKIFIENNLDIPKQIAGIMLSGILSDTLLFKSPTCTEVDKVLAEKLAAIAGVSIHEYGMKMITRGERLDDVSPEVMISTDMKKFTFGQYKVVISQVTTSDFVTFYKIYPKIREALENKCEQDHLDLAVLLVTSIVVGGSELIAVGRAKWMADAAFKMQKDDESIFLNGVFSRKKQIVPKLMEAAHL